MKHDKLIRKIENYYMCYGVKIKLKLILNDEDMKRLIFQIKIKPGTKVDKIFTCAREIKAALQIPLFRPFRDKEIICLAVSEKNVMQNSLLNMLKSQSFHESNDILPIALGYNMMGEMIFADLARMPHIMYAGATNSGKSVGLICLILSLIVKQPVGRANLIIFDVGANKMGVFNGIPHLSYPVVDDVQTGIYVIEKLVQEMEERRKLEQTELQMRPAIICIIDEFVSFMNYADSKKQKELSNKISELLRRGRHAKIHMVLATQNLTKDDVRVDINNITTRIAFQCAKVQNSITILGEKGAEKLTGMGAALYKSNEYPHLIHLQGAFMSSENVGKMISCVESVDQDLSKKFVIPKLDTSELVDQSGEGGDYILNEDDSKKELAEIIMWTLKHDKISASQVKKEFGIGNRVDCIMNEMYRMGLISDKHAKQPRKVIPQSSEDLSPETVRCLEQHEFDEEFIKSVFKDKEEHLRAAAVDSHILP